MSKTEFFAWCIAVSFLGLVWAGFGWPGVLLGIASAIVGQIDLAWIDEVQIAKPAVPLTKPARNWHHTEVLDLKPSGRERAIEHAKKRRKTAQLIQFPRRVG